MNKYFGGRYNVVQRKRCSLSLPLDPDGPGMRVWFIQPIRDRTTSEGWRIVPGRTEFLIRDILPSLKLKT